MTKEFQINSGKLSCKVFLDKEMFDENNIIQQGFEYIACTYLLIEI
jgi:hypothetical protein